MIFVLLVAFQVKHFLCDYPLQRPYMLRKFLPGWDFILPLTAHAGVHGAFTFGIVYWATRSAKLSAALALFDFGIHFVVDRLKAGPKYLGRFKALSASDFKKIMDAQRTYSGIPVLHPEIKMHMKSLDTQIRHNTYFWWSLGLDQLAHHLTHYAIIYVLAVLQGWSYYEMMWGKL